MKPPYVIIDAVCERHGQFRVERKPNKLPDNGSGQHNAGFYYAVKCPKCPWWAKIVRQELVAAQPVAPAVQQGELL